MDEQDTKQMRLLLIGVLGLVLTIASCTSYEVYQDNTAITEMVKAGADPLRAKCSVTTDTTLCVAVSSKESSSWRER